MSNFSDFCAQIMEWTNRQDFAPTLVTSFVRMAEQDFNQELRVDRMIRTVDALVASRCAPLPPDWIESDFTRLANAQFATGFMPIYYKPRAEFFASDDNVSEGTYTIEGRQIFIGGAPDTVNGQTVRIDYYAEVPVFSDAQDSWVYTRYPALYLNAALYHAALHAVGEEQSAANFKALVDQMIQKLNAVHRYARASGSRLSRTPRRSFG